MPRRPSKASFTSLSTRLGEIVSELHLKLVSLIESPASSRHPEYLLALLALARTLAQNSPYSRMSRPLAQPLASAVLPLVNAQGGPLECPGSFRADLSRAQILSTLSRPPSPSQPSLATLSVSPHRAHHCSTPPRSHSRLLISSQEQATPISTSRHGLCSAQRQASPRGSTCEPARGSTTTLARQADLAFS